MRCLRLELCGSKGFYVSTLGMYLRSLHCIYVGTLVLYYRIFRYSSMLYIVCGISLVVCAAGEARNPSARVAIGVITFCAFHPGEHLDAQVKGVSAHQETLMSENYSNAIKRNCGLL